MITPRNVARHELIGLDAAVVAATNPALAGIAGRIVDETRNLLVIRTARGDKRVEKRACTFRLRLPDGTVTDVPGTDLIGQPERRI